MVMEIFFRAVAAAVIPLDTPQRRRQHRLNRFPKFQDLNDHDRMYRWGLLEEGDPQLLRRMLDWGVSPESIDSIIKSVTIKF